MELTSKEETIVNKIANRKTTLFNNFVHYASSLLCSLILLGLIAIVLFIYLRPIGPREDREVLGAWLDLVKVIVFLGFWTFFIVRLTALEKIIQKLYLNINDKQAKEARSDLK
jgi:type II secretory pathway component PulM